MSVNLSGYHNAYLKERFTVKANQCILRIIWACDVNVDILLAHLDLGSLTDRLVVGFEWG